MRRRGHCSWVLALGIGAVPVAGQGGASCRIEGRVVDADLADPIGGVSVWVENAGGLDFLGGATTSADGRFDFDVRACGAVELHVRMIGYADGLEAVEFEKPGEVRRVTVRLVRTPLELEELRVDVTQSPRLREAGFYARMAWEESTGRDYGQFYDPEEVAGRSASTDEVTAIAMGARLFYMYKPHGLCGGPTFYVDGRRIDPRRPRIFERLDDLLPVENVEGMEIYRPVQGAIPDAFRDPNSNQCGLVLIWTKDGNGATSLVEVELCEPSPTPRGLTFEGVVTDRLTGLRLAAANVTLVTTGRDGTSTERATLSDTDGRYRYCDLDALPVSIEARYGEAAMPARRIPARATQSGTLNLEIPVTRPGALAGRVIGLVAYDDLLLELEGTRERARPDAHGFFEFENVAPGDYVLTATLEGEVVARLDVSVGRGATAPIELQIPR